MNKKRILVLCTGNSCRSQMAEGYLRKFSGEKVDVYSAGIEAHGVNPTAIRIMLEDGIDISRHTSNGLSDYLDIKFDFVITVCDNAQERCPLFLGPAQKFHQDFIDPTKMIGSEEEILAQFRVVREQIKIYCQQFINANL